MVEESLKNLMKLKDAALSCVQCGQCRAANWPLKRIKYVCPVLRSDLSPKFEPFYARGKNVILKGLLLIIIKFSLLLYQASYHI